ncbi:MAG: outer membrane protein assembly factor BamD [Candidatus Dependentiae bacterium]|nr:outer membrane protein assembly factor BamD [Candidatus Dependentiae bacterium]
MKKSLFIALIGVGLALGGCGKKKEEVAKVVAADALERKKELAANIFTAVNKRDYENAQRMISDFIDFYPGDPEIPSFKLMIADVKYEQEKFAEAYEAYQHFQEYYPADQHAEYAAYKSAHAKFNQANHVACDSTPIEKTLELCRSYLSRKDYLRYRPQMEDLARTCERNLLDKELYVVNSYMTQNRFASARHRLANIAERFDLSMEGKAHYLYCKAKLAKAENNDGELAAAMDDLHTGFKQSQFTAMADRLVGKKSVLFG